MSSWLPAACAAGYLQQPLTRLTNDNKKLGHITTLVENGFEALVCARGTSFALIFTDYKMPRINGVHLCRHLRLTLTNERTPIIMCSVALEELDTETLQQKVSPITFLRKPVDLLLLPGLIQSAIGQSLGMS